MIIIIVMTSNGSNTTEEQMQLVVAMDSVLRLEQDFEEIVKKYIREKMVSTDILINVACWKVRRQFFGIALSI